LRYQGETYIQGEDEEELEAEAEADGIGNL
jgi:hypothetical protein